MFNKKKISIFCLMIMSLFILVSCGKKEDKEEIDPYAGTVLVADGMGGEMRVALHENLEVSDFKTEDFKVKGQYVEYVGENYETAWGIDVSEHQREIDWAAVKAEGIDFAVLRIGYRGFTEGGIFEDPYFHANIAGAKENGIDVGVYFFSQAITKEEAIEEAEFALEILGDYDLELPVFYDWEKIGVTEARTDHLDYTVLTDCALAFCETIKNAGREAGVYFYRHLGYYEYELDRLGDLIFWSAAPGDFPDFHYKHEFWQYSFTAQIKGIEGDTDLNLWFKEIPKEEENVEA